MPAIIATLTMNPSLDLGADVDHVRAEDKLRTGPPRRAAGGGGVNVARVLARLGHDVVAVYPAGGPTGGRLRELLDEEGVKARPVAVEAETRMNITITETATDQQYRFVLPGPALHDGEWKECLRVVGDLSPDIVVASGSLPDGVPDDVFARVVDSCHPARVIVDTSGAALRAVADARPFLIKPNARELEQLCGREITEHADFGAALTELSREGAAEVIVLSLGAGGAFVVSDGQEPRHIPAPVVPIASKVGAGDSMVAGIVAGLVRGMEVVEAVHFGVVTGAAAVSTPGTELARKEDVEAIWEQVRSAATT